MKPALMGWLFFLCVLFFFPNTGTSKTVMDQLGRSVDVPDHAKRVVSLAPSITEIFFALGLENRLMGATQFSDYPPAAEKLPKVGSYVHLDVERIVSLKPDLCIAVKDGNPITVVRKLEAVGIPVYGVDPRDLTAVIDTMTEIGRLMDAEDQAESIVAEMTDRVHQVEKQVSCADHRPGVFFQIGITPIVSAGTPTFIHKLIERAGGTNLAQGPTPYPRFSKEQVISLWPEVFIITSMARNTIFEEVKAEWSQWRDLPAVKNNRIHLVNSDSFHRASPRLVEGLETLAHLIHPECFIMAKSTKAKP